MKNVKKVLASLLISSMLFASVCVQPIQAADEILTRDNASMGLVTQSDEVTITNLTCETVDVIENSEGYYRQEAYDSTTGTYDEYFYYDIQPTFSVVFSDGTTYTNQRYGLEHNGQYYWLSVSTDQSYSNQWGRGRHTAIATLGEATSEVVINIVETPIVSLTCESVEVIEETNGYFATGYDSVTGEQIEYYYYNNLHPRFSVTFSDGTTLNNQSGGINYNGQWYSLNTVAGQNCMEPWGIGEHTVTANLMGYETEFTVNIVESPITSIKIEDIDIIEKTNGYETSGYNPDTYTYETYYHYNYTLKKGEVSFKDGSVQLIENQYFHYKDQFYNIELSAEQGVCDQWGLGAHTVRARIAGVETTYTMNIVESPYVAIEVVAVAPLVENTNGYESDGEFIYYMPDFSYKLTYKDGTTCIKYYNGNDEAILVETNQYTNPWTAGGENYFTVSCPVGLTAQGKVEIKEALPYEYYEKNGEIYITGCNRHSKVVEIPSEIDGKPVVAVESLGYGSSVEQIIIPDSVKTIAVNSFGFGVNSISIGSGVTYLDAEMFYNCENLEKIIVSEENATYCSVDGILYDKNIETVVAYPRARGNEYLVPDTVKDISVMFYPQYENVKLSFATGSSVFVEEDGVIYNSGKTKVLSCDVGKVGECILPDTVTEIARYAFEECSHLTGISIPSGVTQIAYATFANCTSLTNVQLPDSLKTIEGYAFAGCDSLVEITLPDSLQKIGVSAFAGSYLKGIAIPNSVEYIGVEAFWHSALEKVVFGTGLTTIDVRAFARTPLKIVAIPDNVISLGKEAFISCGQLEQITVGQGVSSIPDSCFWNCSSLREVTFMNKQVAVGEFAFDGCPIETINMENVKEFGLYSFSGSELKSVTIAQGVTEIVYGAFRNSTNLSEIDIPETAVKIGGHVFDGTEWESQQGDGAVYLEHVFYKYNGMLPSDGLVSIKGGTTVIADYALEEMSNLTEVILPNSLLTIGEYAFFNCNSLTEIIIPASVSYIGEYAFARCDNLSNIYVDPNNPYYMSIDGVLFNKDGTELIWCSKQLSDTYVVPYSVERIKAGAFGNSGQLDIRIENSNTVLEDYSIGFKRIQWYSFDRVEDSQTISCYENSKAYEYARNNILMVNILTPTITEIAINTMPNKTEYERGELLDTTGLSIVVSYSDGSKEIINEGYEMGVFDSSTSGVKYVDISYKGVKTELEAIVKVPTVKDVKIERLPNKLEYICGQSIDITGLSLLVSYSDGSTQSITEGFEIAEYDFSVSSGQTITILYEGFSISFEVVVIQEGKVRVGDAKGRAGNTVEVKVGFEKAVNIKSIAIKDLVYDTSKLQLISGAWNVDGVLADWNMEKQEGVLTFADNTKVEQFFTFTFIILEGTEDGEIPVECQIVAKELIDNVGETDINITYNCGTVTVYSVIPGDMDGNDITNSDDAIYLLYYVMMPERYPINQDCDFNGDGVVNSDDAIYLLYHVMMPDKYPLSK